MRHRVTGGGSWGRRLCRLLVGAGGDDVAHGESLVAEVMVGRSVVPSWCSSRLTLFRAEPLSPPDLKPFLFSYQN